jgi:hypothetical protein
MIIWTKFWIMSGGWKKGFAKVMHSCVDFACAKSIALHLNKATLFQPIIIWILVMCNFLGEVYTNVLGNVKAQNLNDKTHLEVIALI